MSAKTISSDITPKVNQKGNRLYDIFAMKVAFSSLYFVYIKNRGTLHSAIAFPTV